ncbi:hypothetical protein BKA66DRAFT_54456 [Pyrenochaeta sp. MPI-SDFR-AT-0127]|nr:hypothetical protein BKA66DRAFT_54456 [Pyrenochaeta sp. MPI-SDFR-AT-0127]
MHIQTRQNNPEQKMATQAPGDSNLQLRQPTEICLIKLLPKRKRPNSIVEIELSYVGLESSPTFEAVSRWYTEDGLFTSQIMCDGQLMLIYDSLHHVLLELREDRRWRLLWIDELCVKNSKSVGDLALLDLVYAKADRTICWVGAPVPSSIPRMISCIHQLDGASKDNNALTSDPDPYNSNFKVTIAKLQQFQALPLFEDETTLKVLNDFLDLEYFQSYGVIENWMTGKNLVLYYESETYSWNDFCTALEMCFFYCTEQCPSSSNLFNIVVSRYLRKRYQSQPTAKVPRRELLLAMQHCNLETKYSGLSTFDFDSSIEGTFVEKVSVSRTHDRGHTKKYANGAKPLGLLLLSLSGPRSLLKAEYPSWAPDWTLRRNNFLLNHGNSKFCASNNRNDSCAFGVDNSMHLSGIILDVVKATSEYLPSRRHCDHYKVGGFNNVIFTDWYEFAQHMTRRPNQSEEELLVQFADTIQARGCNSIWEPELPHTPEELAEKTRSFLEFLVTEDSDATLEMQLFYAACFPSHGRKFGMTKRGNFCLVPKSTRPGDLVCIPHGSRVPFIFRRSNVNYNNIGECYVHGCMQGIAESDLNDYKEEFFKVV